MTNVWEEIGKIEPDLMNPHDVVKELFSPLKSVTSEKVDFRIQRVDFFPEEVEYTSVRTSLSTLQLGTIFDERKKVPHPEFGYNPDSAKAKESFRYRLLLMPSKDHELEVELFKFKFPIGFYPVIFYIEKTDFPELSDLVNERSFSVTDQNELTNVVGMIVKSSSTLKLLKRLMAL